MQSESAKLPIAIVGMGCRLPGANHLADYWRLIRDGQSQVAPLPGSRFDRSILYDPKKGVRTRSYSDLACLVDESYRGPCFDRLPTEIQKCPEVAYRTLCEVAAEAFDDAGLDWQNTSPRNAGVYVGHTRNSNLAGDLSYATCIEHTAPFLSELESFQAIGNDGSQIVAKMIDGVRRDFPHRDEEGGPALGACLSASLVAKSLGLNGPRMAFNSACASSLNALVQAIRALQFGAIEMAVVGGASYCHYDTLVMFSQAQSLSATGSRPFDSSADGLVVGEGYAAIVLKTLEQAQRDNDRVLAVIPSVGISSDGRGKSLWAPRKEGQIEAIRRAHEALGDPALQYIEAHATSTQLGDATEIEALGEAISANKFDSKVALGSVKANIGHTLETAGLSGLIKTVLCLQHETIPPAINVQELNTKVDWQTSPFRVPQQPERWERPRNQDQRRAAVNAFGIGGLNVHVILEEPKEGGVSSRPALPRGMGRPTPVREVGHPEAIAIIGRGLILPGAHSVKAFSELLQSKADPKSRIAPERWPSDRMVQSDQATCYRSQSALAGQVTGFEYDWRKHKIPPKQIQQASPMQFMILDSVEQAFTEAQIDLHQVDRTRIGAIVGNVFGGEFSNQLLMGLRLPEFKRRLDQLLQSQQVSVQQRARIAKDYEELLLKRMPALLDETGSFTSSSLVSRITKSFDLMGGGVAVDAELCSSAASLSCCRDLLLGRDLDLAICVGGQEDLGVTRFEAMSLAGLISDQPNRSPFDQNADGTVPGEGCVVLLLARLSDAVRDQRPIFGIIRGIGAAAGEELETASRLAIERAIGEAGRSGDPVAVRDISKVETTTLGVAETSVEELQGISSTYQLDGRARKLYLDCLTPRLGHTAAAAGLAALVRVTSELEDLRVPAAFATLPPNDSLLPSPSATIASTEFRLEPFDSRGRVYQAVHNTGFSDLAYHLIVERGSTVDMPQRNTDDPHQMASRSIEMIHGLIHFDATQRRKEQMRAKSSAKVATNRDAAIEPPAQPKPAPSRSTPSNPAQSNGSSAAASALQPIATVTPEPATAPTAAERAPATSSSSATSWSRDELHTFLVNFVVEQTGYPPEIVEMDVDLEADLGIDSIKKAQLFGELRDHFDITPDESMTLDDFPTLTTIADFLLAQTGGGASSDTQTTGAATVQVTTSAAQVEAYHASSPASSNGSHSAPAEEPAESSWTADDLGQFLINFVVEQTGYPPEIVEMDVDLEADLGIDSIKKAQLFGELREHFDITPDENLTLDDFPTLQTIADFLLKQTGGGTASSTSSQEVIETATGSSARIVPAATVANTPPTSNLDPVYEDHGTTEGSQSWSESELHAFLVNFVVEQTGYPEEIVELDVDLEADLGIDSIKKAQLFGELREHFDITPDESMTLDDFPTLRTIADFIGQQTGGLGESQPHAAPPELPPNNDSPSTSHGNGQATASTEAAAGDQESDADGGWSREELNRFLVNFVVEQTGYPEEIVELDVDLEADLGIDSIKKAQLFGELREHFDITPDDNLTLDDFPTLNTIAEFILLQTSGAQSSVDGSSSSSVVGNSATMSRGDDNGSAAATSDQAVTTESSHWTKQDIQTFAIQFIVHQTGYPVDIVEMDADLESELGVDSVEKAQLFGEARERFDIQIDESRSMDDFPTLQHVCDYIEEELGVRS